MLKLMLGCSKVYISETPNRTALVTIERAAKLFSGASIVNKFEDETYNRVGYTLVVNVASEPSGSCSLKNAVFTMVKAAFEAIDLRQHQASHPRLGVVDHICFHPIVSASFDQIAPTAKSLAADVGSRLQVPTFLYVVVIGATKWVDNYNIPVFSNNIAAVRRISKKVSGRGGGLHSVQSMALVHGDVTEVACNLLEPSKVGGDQVQHEVERLGEEEGVTVGKGYFTDFHSNRLLKGI